VSDKADRGMWWKAKARFPFNSKVMALSDAAFRLHVSVSCWCCDEVNDGMFSAAVPSGMPKAPQGRDLTKAIREIVKAGLWKPTIDGYEINDFLKYNMSRVQWEALKERGKLGGLRSGESRRRGNEPPTEAPASPPTKPAASAGAKGKRPAPAEHDHDHDHEKSNKGAAAKDLKASARAAAENQAAAAAGVLRLDPSERASLLIQSPDLASAWQPWAWPEVRAFQCALEGAWGRPVVFGGAGDPFMKLLLDALATGSAHLFEAAGAELGAWLAQNAPDGSARGLGQVTFPVLRRAIEDAAEAASRDAGVEALFAAARAAGGEA